VKIFYDTEFIEDGRTIDLISIGMVREDGAEYYAVNHDAPWGRIREHAWLCGNVVPQLPLAKPVQKPIPFASQHYFTIDTTDVHIRPCWLIANEVREFIRSVDEPELWADYGAYDHVVLCQLWGSMIDLPEGLPMFTRDLRQEINRLGLTDGELPAQADGVHNALEDARHVAIIGQHLASVARGQR
jgi:hypothetical protein